MPIKTVQSSQSDFNPNVFPRSIFNGSLLVNVIYIPFEKFTFSSKYPLPGTFMLSLKKTDKNLTVASQRITVGQCTLLRS